MSLMNTPSGERVHVTFFGARNAGKSSLINAVAGQEISIVSDIRLRELREEQSTFSTIVRLMISINIRMRSSFSVIVGQLVLFAYTTLVPIRHGEMSVCFMSLMHIVGSTKLQPKITSRIISSQQSFFLNLCSKLQIKERYGCECQM